MGLLQWIVGLTNEHKVEELAETLAARSFEGVWDAVHDRAAMLSGNTLRGYVRARGGTVIRTELSRVEEFVGVLGDEVRVRVVERALDDLVRRTMLRASASRRVATQRRAAA